MSAKWNGAESQTTKCCGKDVQHDASGSVRNGTNHTLRDAQPAERQ